MKTQREAQKYLLDNNLNDEVLNKSRYRENTLENAKKWKHASDVMIDFAEQKCKEQRDICADKTIKGGYYRHAILNAKLATEEK